MTVIAISPVWIVPAWAILSVLVGAVVGKVIRFGDGTDDEHTAGADERQAQATLYSLRSYEKRTDYVVPRNRQNWS